MNNQLKFGIILFILGFAGILTTLLMPLPLENLPQEAVQELQAQFSELQIRLLFLINPTILLLGAVIIGTALHQQVNLGAPLLENLLTKKPVGGIFKAQLITGSASGIVAGLLILLVAYSFQHVLPSQLTEEGAEKALPPLVRFLYGGLTEEIMMRFGLMTFIVWLTRKITGTLTVGIYLTGIILAALVFAAGHLPLAYQLTGSLSPELVSYVMLGNSIGGVIYGWLYWKKGLEAAFVAHMVSHVVLLTALLY